jgi:hypothetical protein
MKLGSLVAVFLFLRLVASESARYPIKFSRSFRIEVQPPFFLIVLTGKRHAHERSLAENKRAKADLTLSKDALQTGSSKTGIVGSADEPGQTASLT